ncbi:MAG: energy transducer TonB [Caulobacteraceae bacterium]|nr:energy transducer TonB [Caulobacteraceae bacterium]
MRVTLPGLLIVLCLAGAGAMAQTAAPGGGAVESSAYPHAFVFCRIAAEGLVSGCEAVSEAPAGQKLGAAAVKAMNGMKTAPPAGLPKGANAGLLTPVCFDLSGAAPRASAIGAACALPPSIYTMSDVLTKPTTGQFRLAWPARASEAGIAGRAILNCMVDGDGKLHGCSVISETPAGEAFGRAALSLTQYYALRPKVMDGAAVPGTITLAVIFDAIML